MKKQGKRKLKANTDSSCQKKKIKKYKRMRGGRREAKRGGKKKEECNIEIKPRTRREAKGRTKNKF